jgi:tetratricopeptide (TPR) repeat protein
MVEANRASYQAAKNELSEKTLRIGTYDALHAMDYLVFGELQQGRDKAAKEVVDDVARIKTVNVENFVAAYALAAIPARYAVERNDWKGAASLQLSPSNLAWQKFPQAEAVLVSVRGLAAARTGAIPAARKDLVRLADLKEAMKTAKIGYWPGQTDFQMQAIEAWIALEEKHPERALQLMRSAAEMEEASDKHPVTPGSIVPMRELLAEMLLRLDQPALALTEFESSLTREPNRFRSIYGAAIAARASKNSEAAKNYYRKLRSLTAEADTTRQEMKQADAFLAAAP